MHCNDSCHNVQMWCVFILSILIQYSYVHGQSYAGDDCNLNGAPGTCALIDDCPEVLKNAAVKRPQFCRNREFSPVVCCPNKEGNETTQVDKDIEVGKKAKEKCLEYGTYIYEWVLPDNETDPEKKVKINTCGHIASALVIGHDVTSLREYPHMALLGRKKTDNTRDWICGGALISEEYVLTSAFCTNPSGGELRYVRLGEYSLDIYQESEIQDFTIDEIIWHPGFNFPAKYHNIALLKLDRRAILNKFVIPACLHTEFDVGHKTATATGWGAPGKEDEWKLDLSKIVLEIFAPDECNTTLASAFDHNLKFGITESMLCAGHRTLKRGTCARDGGGPLQVYLKKPYCMYDILGVTSFGVGCGLIGIPEVYSRVSYYVEWIESIVWPN